MNTVSQHPNGTPPGPAATDRSPLEHLVRGIGAHALECVGARADAESLTTMGPLTDPGNQLRAVRALGRGILAADVAAVRATESVLESRSNLERIEIISALGEHSAASAQEVEDSLATLVTRATRQTHVAAELVKSTRATVADRHGDRQFAFWVSTDPDGFSRYVWSASLHAAGARVWDRNWSKLLSQAENAANRTRPGSARLRTSSESLERATTIARDAAIRSLVDTALDDAAPRDSAWVRALEQAEMMPGTVAWTRHAQMIRADLGAITWSTTNSLIGNHVAVVINELPWIAGFVGMIALAAEATVASARTSAVLTGSQAMAGHDELADALDAARGSASGNLAESA